MKLEPNKVIIISCQFFTCPLSLQMSRLCGRTAEHNAAGMLWQRSAAAHFPRLKVSALKQGSKGTWTMKNVQALSQHKNGLTFWIPEWKNMKPYLSVSLVWCSYFFSHFRGYHQHKSRNKYSFHTTGVLACPQPPLYPHIHKFSGTCPCLRGRLEKDGEMVNRGRSTARANSQQGSPVSAERGRWYNLE